MKKRAFVKYTKKGTIIPGSLIVTTQGGYPRDGIYKEIPAFANDSVDGCGTVITGTIAVDFDMNGTGSFDVSMGGVSVFNQVFPATSYVGPTTFTATDKTAVITIITGATPTCPANLFIWDNTTSTPVFQNLNIPYNTTYTYSFIMENGHDYSMAAAQPAVCP